MLREGLWARLGVWFRNGLHGFVGATRNQRIFCVDDDIKNELCQTIQKTPTNLTFTGDFLLL